ncbi:GNAT family N-acetyltransferase [Cellulomonas soli]|uniref:GNAT family N-acetyltransferase n=1 Tax=Cellulomonas soli TaxID=931535 RepID=UPI003F85504A
MPLSSRLPLTTRRLVLRPFRATDGPALHSMLSRPEAVRFEPYGVLGPVEADRLAAERTQDDRFLAVTLTDGTFVGNLYVAPDGPPHWRTWQVGYVFHPGHWGHGYATEAVTALIDELVLDGAHRVVARCDPRNTRSWSLLDRVGLRREAHHRQAASFEDDEHGHPVWHDTFQYAVLAEEWRARTS